MTNAPFRRLVIHRGICRLARLGALCPAMLALSCKPESASQVTFTPLQVQVTPARDAMGVEVGAPITLVFSVAMDPGTITPASISVKQSGVPLTTAISYDATTRTARVSAPLLPATTYQVEVTTAVRSSAGAALSAPDVRSFTTRTMQQVTIDAASEAGLWSALARDGSGRLHIVHDREADADGELRYTTCTGQCLAAANWQSTTFTNTGYYASTIVDGNARLHVSYTDVANVNLAYATCSAACTTAANWQRTIIDAPPNGGLHSSLGVDATGRIHVTYLDLGNADLKYATCSATCTSAVSWQKVAVNSLGLVGEWSSLAVESGGRVHVSYFDRTNGDLKYSICAANCTTTVGWQTVTVDAAGIVGEWSSLKIDASGAVYITYFDQTNGDLKFATCPANCATVTSWQRATVDVAGFTGVNSRLLVDAYGRLHVTYSAIGFLRYATCAATCSLFGSWSFSTLDANPVSPMSSLMLDPSGRLRVSYNDAGRGLKYME